MVSAWERALARGEGPAAPVKRKYQDLTPAGRAELRRSVARRNLAPAPLPERSTRQSESQRSLERFMPTYENTMVQQGDIGGLTPEYLRGEAVRTAELARDVFTPYQEFRAAEQAASEGRAGAAAGWGLLGLAGMVPLVGDVAQGLGAAGRAAGLAGDVARGAERAADVGRSPRITLRADDVERVQGIGNEHWFRVPDPDNPRARMTLPGSSGGGRLGGRPMTLDEVPDEIYHVTTNASGIRADGMINVSRGGDMGAGGTSGSGAVSLSASREAAETLASDLRAYAELKTLATEDDVMDFLLGISRRDGMTQESLSSLEEYLRRAAASSKGREAFVPEIHSKGIYDAWQFARGSRGGPNASIIIGNPFGDYWRTVRPEDIDIISVNKRQIPEGALINDYDVGRGALDEIQVYADIPLPRVSERAADVGRAGEALRVVPQNIADNLSQEIRSGGLQYTKPNIENVPRNRRATAEIVYRQGFEAPARSVPSENFDTVVSELRPRAGNRLPFESKDAGKPIVVYRGLADEGTMSGVDYARSLIDGEYYVGYGAYGHGSYFSEKFHDAVVYSARQSGPSGGANGAVVRAVVSPEARLLDFSNVEAQRAFGSSGFSNISEFAAASGYDGIIIPKGGMNHVNILNRSVLIFDYQPRVVTIYDLSLINTRSLSYDQLQDDLFRGASNRKNFELAGESLPSETKGLNF